MTQLNYSSAGAYSGYLLKLHIESAGTIHTSTSGQTTPSSAGHAWVEVILPTGQSYEAGFGPSDPKGGASSVPGKVFDNDGAAYAGNPFFTVTYKISAEQASKLVDFGDNPAQYNFNKESYHAVNNSCVDFVWKGLEIIGMNPNGFQGDLLPKDNTDDLSGLRNPSFGDGGLLMIERNFGQDIEYFNQPANGAQYQTPYHDWWWDDVNPTNGWWSIPDPTEPSGYVEVGPITPSTEEDGNDYNSDGTSYQ